jgi:phospholipase D1/2
MTLGPLGWLRLAVAATVVALVAVAWVSLPYRPLGDMGELAEWTAPHRHAWYGLPVVVTAYVLLGFLFVPVLLLITATGIAFGPILGPVYAMAGCLTSASAGFGIGRWVGRQRIKAFGGEYMLRLSRTIERNGTLAVFLIRKIPAPFVLSNIVVGASRVSFRDFLVGTLLGMTALVIGLAGLGHQLTLAFRNPSWSNLGMAAAFIGLPLSLAWYINRRLRQGRVSS